MVTTRSGRKSHAKKSRHARRPAGAPRRHHATHAAPASGDHTGKHIFKAKTGHTIACAPGKTAKTTAYTTKTGHTAHRTRCVNLDSKAMRDVGVCAPKVKRALVSAPGSKKKYAAVMKNGQPVLLPRVLVTNRKGQRRCVMPKSRLIKKAVKAARNGTGPALRPEDACPPGFVLKTSRRKMPPAPGRKTGAGSAKMQDTVTCVRGSERNGHSCPEGQVVAVRMIEQSVYAKVGQGVRRGSHFSASAPRERAVVQRHMCMTPKAIDKLHKKGVDVAYKAPDGVYKSAKTFAHFMTQESAAAHSKHGVAKKQSAPTTHTEKVIHAGKGPTVEKREVRHLKAARKGRAPARAARRAPAPRKARAVRRAPARAASGPRRRSARHV